MASPSTHAMPEHWTELSAARKQRRLCSEAIRALRSSCDQGCETKPAAECASCYAKALERIRLRYVDSRDREWFTQRGAFLPELEGLLQDAKGRATTLELVEARIESEKEAWYRWVLRRYPEFLAVADHGPASHGALRAMLDDADRSRQELVAAMLEGIGTPAGWPRSVDALADKAAAATSGDELKALYIGQFFEDGGSGRALDHAGKYLDEYRARDGGRLEDVMDSIASDLRESRRARPQREGHLRRLDELRRAKTAFEHNKARAKSRAPRSSQAPAPAGRLGALPPCHVCRGTVDRSAVLSCSLCQAAAQMGGSSGGGDLTVYCSEQCFCKGHDGHVEAAHGCEAGDACVEPGSEAARAPASCSACLDQGRMTLFCSEWCAAAHVAAHRQGAHGVTTAAAAGAVTGTQRVVDETLARENPGVAMARVE